MKTRNALIDVGKGFGILLVVAGHVIQMNTVGFDNIFFRLIYSFHMPLFIFLSGCVSKYGDYRSVTKNITRLVLPFFAWYLVGLCVQWYQSGVMPDFADRIHNLYKSPDYGLWFLWILFVCHVCFYLMFLAQKYGAIAFVKSKIKNTKFINPLSAGISGAAIVFILIQYIPFNVLGVGLLKWHFPFFVTGFLVMRYQRYFVKWKYQLIPLSIVVYFLLFPYWEFSENGLYLSIVDGMGNRALQLSWDFLKFYRYAVSLFGIGVAMSLVYFMIQAKPIEKFLSKLGQYTLEIYVSHQMLFGYNFGSNFVVKVISSFTDAIALSLGLGIVLKKIPVIRTVLYGTPLKNGTKKAAQ